MDPQSLVEYLEGNRERLSPLLILTHDFPDPDALASAVALQFLAEKVAGIRSRVVYGGMIGRSENREMARLLKLPVYKLRPSDFRKYPNVAMVDTQPSFDNHSLPRKRKPVIVIDQHASDTEPAAEFTIVDTQAGATSALVADRILDAGLEIPVRLATALSYGIISDTLDFYRITHHETVETYLRLLPMSDVHMLAKIQNPSRPRRYFGELVLAFTRAQVRRPLIVSHLGHVDNPDVVSQMADVLLTCQRMEWAFCTGRHGENLHLSLRTLKEGASAPTMLRAIVDSPRQAGGHGQIAGGKIRVGKPDDEERWNLVEETLTQKLAERLRLRKRTSFTQFIRPASVPQVPGE